MFRRILIEDWTTIFTIVAFVTVASIYLTMLYRTLRLKRSEVEHLSNLPFSEDADETAKPADPAKPAKPADPAKPAKPADSPKPVNRHE